VSKTYSVFIVPESSEETAVSENVYEGLTEETINRIKAHFKNESWFERAKAHVLRNKTTYIVGAVCLAIGVATGYWIKSRPLINVVNTVAPVFINNNENIVNFGGYATKIVKNHLTGDTYLTVKAAAEAAGVEMVRMSRHLNGHIPHINGVVYSIIGQGTTA
jgi:hypothetical protein